MNYKNITVAGSGVLGSQIALEKVAPKETVFAREMLHRGLYVWSKSPKL